MRNKCQLKLQIDSKLILLGLKLVKAEGSCFIVATVQPLQITSFL